MTFSKKRRECIREQFYPPDLAQVPQNNYCPLRTEEGYLKEK
jgi:hypothetical protein